MPTAKHMQNHFTLVLKLSVVESKIWQENNGRMSQDTSQVTVGGKKGFKYSIQCLIIHITNWWQNHHSCAAQKFTHHHNTHSRGLVNRNRLPKAIDRGAIQNTTVTQSCTAQQVAQAYLSSSFLRMRGKNFTYGQCLL